jgi:hypothetical protein
MSDPLEAVLTALGTVLDDLSGLVRWYDEPPESINEFPCGMALITNGELTTISDGMARGLHTIRIAIYLQRQVLPDAVAAAKPWPYRVFRALAAHQKLSGTCDAIVWPGRYRVGPMQYGTDVHFGIAMDVTVKVNSAETTGV